MERRGFLKGLIASVAGGTALVKLATASETAALTVGAPALVGQPNYLTLPPQAGLGDGMVYARTANDFVPIGYITSFQIYQPVDQVMSWSGDIAVVLGLRRATAQFEGP